MFSNDPRLADLRSWQPSPSLDGGAPVAASGDTTDPGDAAAAPAPAVSPAVAATQAVAARKAARRAVVSRRRR